MEKDSIFKKRKGNRPSVCFVTCEYPPDHGGVSKSAKRIVRFLSNAGFDVHVFVPSRDGQVSFRIIEDISIYRVPAGKDFYNRCYRLINSIDKIVDFDIYHGFFLFMSFSCLPFVTKKNKPLITSIRGIELDWLMNKPRYARMGNKILHSSSWVTSVSSESLAEANKIVNISGRSGFIPNSIDISSFRPWQLNADNHAIVGTVATFREKKNIPLLIRSYDVIPRNLRRKLLLVGDFQEKHKKTEENIKKTIQDLGIREEIEITGYINNVDIPNYLTAMHVFVLSSDSEGMPNAILEAAAAGVPIVSTAIDGVNDIFTHGQDALLVPTNNVVGMSMAIEQILSDPDLAHTLSAGAHKLAKKLDLKNEEDQWLALYNNFIPFKI